jgi:ribosomal protein S18 acetylase RimI-like enzyme
MAAPVLRPIDHASLPATVLSRMRLGPSATRLRVLCERRIGSAALVGDDIVAIADGGSHAIFAPDEADGGAYARAAVALAAAAPAGQPLKFSALPAAAAAAISAALSDGGWRLTYESPCACFYWPPERPLSDATAGEPALALRVDDAETADAAWAYRSATSLAFLRGLISRNGGVGVRDAASGALAAWALEYDDGCFGCLGTAAAHRRRGLARACVSAMVARARSAGRAAVCFVVTENGPSLALMRSLGFEEAGARYVWSGFEEAVAADERARV